MLPVIVPTLERLNLVRQTLRSLNENSGGHVYPIVVDDGSKDEAVINLLNYLNRNKEIHLVRHRKRRGIGYIQNFTAKLVGELDVTKDSKYIFFTNNDIYFEKDWDLKMIKAMDENPDIGILGGARHSHHGVSEPREWSGGRIELSDQQAGYSLLMPRKVLKKVGKFIEADINVYGREDSDMCNRVAAAGYKIGALHPPVLVHCGLIHIEGDNTAGIEEMRKMQASRPELVFE